MNKLWSAVKGVFVAAAVAAALLIVLSSLNLFGYRMFVVKSGSMEPAIHTGSVVITRQAASYMTGDVITFKTSPKETATHRITGPAVTGSPGSFTTKGDANVSTDPGHVAPQNVVGKVLFSIPVLGYIVAFMRTFLGLVIFVIIPATVITVDEVVNIRSEAARAKAKRRAVRTALEQSKEIDELEVPESLVHTIRPRRNLVAKRTVVQ